MVFQEQPMNVAYQQMFPILYKKVNVQLKGLEAIWKRIYSELLSPRKGCVCSYEFKLKKT